MKRIFLIFAMLMTLSIGMYAQKPTTTKPSVQELINVLIGNNPIGGIVKIANSNGFRGTEAQSVGGSRYVFAKRVKGGEVQLEYGEYSSSKNVMITTNSSAVARSWEDQIKRLGYHYEGHESQMGPMNSTQEFWTYTKPAYPSIILSHSYQGREDFGYMLELNAGNY